MSLRTQYEFLFVGRDEGGFVENYAYDLGEDGQHSGKIFVTLEIQNNSVDAEQIGEHIFDTMRKTFFSDLEQDGYFRFEQALKEVNKQLRLLKNERASQFIGNLHVVITAIVGNNLYLSQCGDAEAYLLRRRFCSIISEDLYDPQSKDIFSNIANGTLEPEDFILLSSTRLLRYISKADLVKSTSAKNLIATLGELKDYLSAEILGKVAFIGIQSVQPAEFSDAEKNQVIAHLHKDEMAIIEKFTKNIRIAQLKPVIVAVAGGAKKIFAMAMGLKDRLLAEKGRVFKGREQKFQFQFQKWSKEKILGALILIVLVLTGSIWWLRGRAEDQRKIDQFNRILSEVQESIGSAETTGQYNKDQAGQILNDAEKKALTVLNARYFSAKANTLLKAIQESRDKLDGVLHPQTKIMADLRQKRANVSALGLLNLKGIFYAFEYNALYPIILDKVQDPLTIDDNETVIAGTTFTDKDSLLFYTKNGKVIEYKDNRLSFVTSVAGALHKASAFQAYNNKIYLLEPEANQIWKYTRRRDKFDPPEAYNIDADLKKGVSLAVDGNVYILNNDGTLVKLFSGNKQNLVIKKHPTKPLAAPTKIFTQLNLPHLYVLEPKEHRVLVYYKDDKAGGGLIYTAQYIFDDIADMRDLYVDKDANKLYILDQSKVYQANL